MKILIPIDGTDCSKTALDAVINRIWSNKDQFLVLSIVEPPDYSGVEAEEEEDYQKEMLVDCNLLTEHGVKKLKDGLNNENISSRVLKGKTAEQIVQCASDWDADLIVIGTHGHADCRRFLPGSIAEKVLKQSPCSVEVVKLKHKKMSCL